MRSGLDEAQVTLPPPHRQDSTAQNSLTFAAVALSFLNRHNFKEDNMINGPVWNEAEIQPGDTPTVLAIGDSWFWYPRNNLAIPLHRILNRSSNHVILVRGHNGAEAVEYENGPIRKQIEWDLDKKIGYGRTIRAVFLSGGGNDFAGRDDMRALLKGDCSSLSDPSQCFRASQPAQLFEAVQKALLSVVDLVAEKLPGVPVFVHGYDYAVPSGKGFFGLGQWLQYPMDESQVDRGIQQAVVNELIDSFAGALAEASKKRPALHVVNARETLKPDQWANELHPTPRGFNKLATAWEPVLKSAGIA